MTFNDALQLPNDGATVIDPLMTRLKEEHILIAGAELEGKSRWHTEDQIIFVDAGEA